MLKILTSQSNIFSIQAFYKSLPFTPEGDPNT